MIRSLFPRPSLGIDSIDEDKVTFKFHSYSETRSKTWRI